MKKLEELDHDIVSADSFAEKRLRQALESLPARLASLEESLPERLQKLNVAPFVKLRSIHILADQLARYFGKGAPCGQGCSGCCHYNVALYPVEADYIRHSAGVRVPEELPAAADFHGQPCPFLRDGACSIYIHRPLACRMFLAFTRTSYWCAPERANEHNLPQLTSTGLTEALHNLAAETRMIHKKDIREFFGLAAHQADAGNAGPAPVSMPGRPDAGEGLPR